MKRFITILKLFWLNVCLMFAVSGPAVGQIYKPGDLYTFADGTKGIVFYVNPENPCSGTVVALRDVPGKHALWTGEKPSTLQSVITLTGGLNFRSIKGWQEHAKQLTRLLAESGVSPAADAIDVASGWYIPDAMQLQQLYTKASVLQDDFVANGGDLLSIRNSAHWSSTQTSATSDKVYIIGTALSMETVSGTTTQYIRPVRDFPDTAAVQAYWVGTDRRSDMVVKPVTTTSYEAFVVYRSDTLSVSAMVTVHLPVSDTIRESVQASPIPYVSLVAPVFNNLDISLPGNYTYTDTLTAANECDSILVYELTVTPCVSDFDIVCPPDIYDTLAYGDCVMTIYPERLGTPTILYDGDWPFIISNDIPSDYLFVQGDNVITWTVTDPECGGSVTCEQHVVIAFPQCPDAVDYEGNVYHGVRIGCDCWTQRNLESRKYSDGVEITGRYAYSSWQHPDTVANVETYGRLYSFEAAVRDSADNGHGHVQGICPEGWYLPTPEKYEGLNAYGADALRSPEYWLVGAGNNSTGFTALPAGFYNGKDDRFEGLLTETYFWSTQGVGTSVSEHVYAITYYCDSVQEQHPKFGLAYSIRCIKEE